MFSLFRTAALVCAVTLIGGCKQQEQSPDIAVLIDSVTHPYWKAVYDGITEATKSTGKRVYIQSLTGLSDTQEQVNQCENALLHHPKAIIFVALNQVNLNACLHKANEAGIVLVNLNGAFSEEDAKKYGVNVAFSVRANDYDMGKAVAEYVKNESGKALVIEGPPAHYNSVQRVKGFKENIPASLQVVATLSADWDLQKAVNVTNDILTTTPELNVVFAVNDSMALGAAEALKMAGRKGVKVFGIDGIKDALKAIEDGRMTASVSQLSYLMGKTGLEKTAAYLDNPQPMAYSQYTPMITIDRAMLEQKSEPLLQYVR